MSSGPLADALHPSQPNKQRYFISAPPGSQGRRDTIGPSGQAEGSLPREIDIAPPNPSMVGLETLSTLSGPRAIVHSTCTMQ